MLSRFCVCSPYFGTTRLFSSTSILLDNNWKNERAVKASKALNIKNLSQFKNTKKNLKVTGPSKKYLAAQRRSDEDQQRKRQAKHQLVLDKEATIQTKGALKRKMSAITTWAKREHPEIWERIVSKISLKETLKGHPWEPAILLVGMIWNGLTKKFVINHIIYSVF